MRIDWKIEFIQKFWNEKFRLSTLDLKISQLVNILRIMLNYQTCKKKLRQFNTDLSKQVWVASLFGLLLGHKYSSNLPLWFDVNSTITSITWKLNLKNNTFEENDITPKNLACIHKSVFLWYFRSGAVPFWGGFWFP